MQGHAGPIAVAVSGGGDSMALMHLLADHARKRRLPPPIVLTVDHGLRKTSAKDARQVAAWAKQAGLRAHVLVWKGAKPKSGVEAAAREARYQMMGAWLVKHGIAALHVGHTQDDQAETFLLRLARGSGLDGLAAMGTVAKWPVEGFARLHVMRPLLAITRDDLRAHLRLLGQDWLEDPMNADEAFDRVKIRKAQAVLADAGLSPARIAAAAGHLARARVALETMTQGLLARTTQTGAGGLLLDPAMTLAPREVALRALAELLRAVSGQIYRPRFESLERLFAAIVTGGLGRGMTLHGCKIAPASRAERFFGPGTLSVTQEKPRKNKGDNRG